MLRLILLLIHVGHDDYFYLISNGRALPSYLTTLYFYNLVAGWSFDARGGGVLGANFSIPAEQLVDVENISDSREKKKLFFSSRI